VDGVKIVYIDDDLDIGISKYLKREYLFQNQVPEYHEIEFNDEEGYESLINNPKIKESNIVLIDSKLFRNYEVVGTKFSGEEFKIILKNVYPFIEVIVITQNDTEEDFGTISKYRKSFPGTQEEYYEENLQPLLNEAVDKIKKYRNIANKLKLNEGIAKVTIERVMNSLDGENQYEELTTRDIDNLIAEFKEMQRSIDEE
jgi:hypothetical protein